MKQNIVRDRSFGFAVKTVELYKSLSIEKCEFVLSKQLLRSGTSIGANIREAVNAESRRDFIHKLSIAQKEADETLYWLELLKQTNMIDESTFNAYHSEAESILKIIKRIIITAKQNSHQHH